MPLNLIILELHKTWHSVHGTNIKVFLKKNIVCGEPVVPPGGEGVGE